MPGMTYFTNIGAFLKVILGLAPAARADGAFLSAAIDKSGFRSLALDAAVGAVTGTPDSFTLTVKVQHSDASGGTYVDYVEPGEAAVRTVVLSAINTAKKLSVDLSGAKQFIKVSGTAAFVGGTEPTVLSSVGVVLGGADKLPTSGDS